MQIQLVMSKASAPVEDREGAKVPKNLVNFPGNLLGEMLEDSWLLGVYIVIAALVLAGANFSFNSGSLLVILFVSWLPVVLLVYAGFIAIDHEWENTLLALTLLIVFMMAWGASVVPFQEVHVWYILGGVWFSALATNWLFLNKSIRWHQTQIDRIHAQDRR